MVRSKVFLAQKMLLACKMANNNTPFMNKSTRCSFIFCAACDKNILHTMMDEKLVITNNQGPFRDQDY